MDEHLEKKLKEVLDSFPKSETLTVRHVFRQYRDVTGHRFPFENLEFSSFLDYIKTVPHVIKLADESEYTWDSEVLPTVSSLTAHMEELATDQKPHGKKSKKRRRHKKKPKSKSKGKSEGNSSNRRCNILCTPDSNEDEFLTCDSDGKKSEDDLGTEEAEVESPFFAKINERKKIKVPDEILRDLEELLECNPNGILLPDMKLKYKAKFGRPLDHYGYGYIRVMDFLTMLPQVVKLYDLADLCFLIVGVKKFAGNLPDEKDLAFVVRRVMDIVKEKQKLFADEIEQDYLEKYEEELNLSEFGFESNLELYKHLRDYWYLEYLEDGKVQIIHKYFYESWIYKLYFK